MFNRISKPMTTVFTLFVLASPAFAAGGGGDGAGNGGDPCEQRIQKIQKDLKSWINDGRGPTRLKLPAGLGLNNYLSGMKEKLNLSDRELHISCLKDGVYLDPIHKKYPKVCKNYLDAQGVVQLECDYDLFLNKTDQSRQYVLIHHEYAGVAGFEITTPEGRSDYPISNQLSGFVELRIETALAIVPVHPSLEDAASLNFVPIPLNNYCGDNIPDGMGCFAMGSPMSEHGRLDDEVQHTVVLKKPFEMQTTPVTQALWFKEMGSNPSEFCGKDACPETHQLVVGSSGKLECLCPFNPVEQVSWDDAQEFIKKMNAKQDGHVYSLPSEAQWEYSARAGTSTAYYFGNDASELGDNAWYSKNSGGHTHEVARKTPNAFGLYDMSGNVSQLVNDRYGDYSTACSYDIDPTGPSIGSSRVIRGGDWGCGAQYLRSASRYYWYSFGRSKFVGFRLVRTQ